MTDNLPPTHTDRQTIETKILALRTSFTAQIDAGETPATILKSPDLKALYSVMPTLEGEDKAAVGKQLNELRRYVFNHSNTAGSNDKNVKKSPIDVTAPWDSNTKRPTLLPIDHGSRHPLSTEISILSDIFLRMGFIREYSREIDDQYHMFESVNFPADHPARDEYDTFMTVETDSDGSPLIAPAHTSTMQNRILRQYKSRLDADQAIAAIVPDRVFRNEDLDARHAHTFYQLEGIYVAKDVHVGMLIATLQEFLEQYYKRPLEVRLNPFYFPFTEPSFEFALSCPFCDKKGCSVCSQEGWIELIGCGMIHPNVLTMAGIDAGTYSGFAFGCGIDRLVMMKYNIDDVRLFHSGNLNFLRQFTS